MLKRLAVLLFVVLAGLAAACADKAEAPEHTDPPGATPNGLAGTQITVFAASSLTEAFGEIAAAFQEETGAGVAFSFAGSSDLRTQLEQGAPADAFAPADTNQMGLAKNAGVVDGDGTVFARNRLVVIIPKENRAGIVSLEDLAEPDTKVVLAGENVPVGKYARQFLDKAAADPAYGLSYKDAVLANVVTNASNVKEVASAVQLDEVDAGIIYKTDVTSELARDVNTIDIPDDLNVIATYPIAVTSNAAEKTTAQAFIDFVLSDAGQAILTAHGFLKASE